MNGKNTKFATDPVTFLQTNIVNISALMGADAKEILACQSKINTSKWGSFDFQDWKTNVKLRYSGETPKVEKDTPILGYFCPFNGGGEEPGWVDVPRAIPMHKFVFTPAMNGCAFVITDSPTSGCFRVHHHQHPIGPDRRREAACAGATVEYDRLSEAEYDLGSTGARVTAAKMFACFNFLFLGRDGSWRFVSQASEFPAGGGNDPVWTRPSRTDIVSRVARTSAAT